MTALDPDIIRLQLFLFPLYKAVRHTVTGPLGASYTAVCHYKSKDTTRKMVNIERSKLSPEAREGVVLYVDGTEYKVDATATDARKREVRKLMYDIWK